MSGSDEYIPGGSGGLIVPGTSVSLYLRSSAAAYSGIGGSAGGSGAVRKTSLISVNCINNGGEFNQSGGTLGSTSTPIAGGGGGGGWGASGGRGKRQTTLASTGARGGYFLVRGGSGQPWTSDQIFIINPNNHIAGTFL
jgi:hypothetical protein